MVILQFGIVVIYDLLIISLELFVSSNADILPGLIVISTEFDETINKILFELVNPLIFRLGFALFVVLNWPLGLVQQMHSPCWSM